jgi:hypothetical protein
MPLDNQGLQVLLYRDESLGALLVSAVAALFFAMYFAAHLKQEPSWLKLIGESAGYSLSFIVIAFTGFFFLRACLSTFGYLYGSFTSGGSQSWVAWRRAVATWGGPIRQTELTVNHFVEVESVEPLPTSDPTRPILYQTVRRKEPVMQNSIAAFRGVVDLALDSPAGHGLRRTGFNTYRVAARYVYQVVNQSDLLVKSEFLFPLAIPGTNFHELLVEVDGREPSSLRAEADGLHWTMDMLPHQQVQVLVSYRASGTDGFVYEVTSAREIRDFELVLSSNASNLFPSVAPSGETVRMDSQVLSDGSFHSTTRIDRAVVAPSIGVWFIQAAIPYAPQDSTIHILRFIPRAFIFFLVVLAVTLRLGDPSFRIRDLALISALFSLPLLSLILISPSGIAPTFLLIVSSGIVIFLFVVILRRVPRAQLALVLAWGIFFLVVYPLISRRIGSYPENPYDSVVLSAIIVYLFFYTLGLRLYERRGSRPSTKRA